MTHYKRGYELGLMSKDVIHNPNDKSYENFIKETSTKQIEFLTTKEVKQLSDYFYKSSEEHKSPTVGKFSFLFLPQRNKIVDDIITPKLKELFPDGVYYKDVTTDNVYASSDFYMYQKNMIIPPHTDSIIHVANYHPYKDIIIPLELGGVKDAPFCAFKQRFYGRASSFRYGMHNDDIVAIYSNSIRYQKYSDYGVKYTESDEINDEFYRKYLHTPVFPKSIWDGLSPEGLFTWIPGSAIIMDPSVVHSPTNYQDGYKLGLTFRLLKYDPSYNPDPLFSRYLV